MSKFRNSQKCRDARHALYRNSFVRSFNMNFIHKVTRATLFPVAFITFLAATEAAMASSHHGIQDARPTKLTTARKIGAWTIESLEYAQGEKVPSECVITQGSMRIISDSGQVVFIELDRDPSLDETGLSSNSRVEFVTVDSVKYWIKSVTSRDISPENGGISIDDPKITTYFSHNKSNWRNIIDLAPLLKNKRTLRIVGRRGENISVLQLSRFGEVKALCGF